MARNDPKLSMVSQIDAQNSIAKVLDKAYLLSRK